MHKQIEIAKDLACLFHHGQFRRDGVTPYIVHPEAVAESLMHWNYLVVATAFVHDLKEKTDITYQQMRDAGLEEEIIKAVKALTHPRGEPYMKYIARVSRNEIAKIVKVADIMHNSSDSPSLRQQEKYKKALAFLARV